MKKLIQNMLWVGAGALCSVSSFADVNPYTMFGTDNNGSQNQSANPDQSSAEAQSVSSQPSSTIAEPATAPANAQPASAQYQTPAALTQPGSNVGKAVTASSPKPLVVSPSVTSSSPPPSFTSGLLPNTVPSNYAVSGESAASGTVPTGTGSSGALASVLQQINQNIKTGNTQLMNRFSLEDSIDYPNPPPSFSVNLVPTDSGFTSFTSGLLANQATLTANQTSAATANTMGAQIGASPLTGTSTALATLAAMYQTYPAPVSPSAGTASGARNTNSTPPLMPSNMTLLNQAVMSPFQGAWLTDLSSASVPQLLRIIAIQQAVQNYILYQQLSRSSEQEALQANLLSAVNSMNATQTANSGTNVFYLKQIIKALQKSSP